MNVDPMPKSPELPELGFYTLNKHIQGLVPVDCRWCGAAMHIRRQAVICLICDAGQPDRRKKKRADQS